MKGRRSEAKNFGFLRCFLCGLSAAVTVHLELSDVSA